MSVVTNSERCDVLKGPCLIWVNSQYSLTPNLDIIGKVPTDISILILQGENDTDTPLEQAFLLQQKLTELGLTSYYHILVSDLRVCETDLTRFYHPILIKNNMTNCEYCFM
jgi:uncharacterized protein